jgi:uncharacterized caspase-like protein
VKPKLHILAVGINAYEDEGWVLPSGQNIRFKPLTLALKDAEAIAAELEKAGADYYGDVKVKTALDKQATLAGLNQVIEEMSAAISPRDTFVLFAAAHGQSDPKTGRFYLIPQDYHGGLNPEALKSRAISQELLQDWLVNKIKARHGIILFDTCESGALVDGYARSRLGVSLSEAAIGRLHEATGRPVLTAAAGDQSAGGLTALGHGLFTAALIEALYKGDRNGNGYIEVTELADYVQNRVPQLGKGGEIRAAAPERRNADDQEGPQSPRFGTTGGDFKLVKRLQ